MAPDRTLPKALAANLVGEEKIASLLFPVAIHADFSSLVDSSIVPAAMMQQPWQSSRSSRSSPPDDSDFISPVVSQLLLNDAAIDQSNQSSPYAELLYSISYRHWALVLSISFYAKRSFVSLPIHARIIVRQTDKKDIAT